MRSSNNMKGGEIKKQFNFNFTNKILLDDFDQLSTDEAIQVVGGCGQCTSTDPYGGGL